MLAILCVTPFIFERMEHMHITFHQILIREKCNSLSLLVLNIVPHGIILRGWLRQIRTPIISEGGNSSIRPHSK